MTIQKQGKTFIEMLFKERWLKTTIISFIGIFGYHSIIMSQKIYYCYFVIWLIGGIGCLINFKELFVYKKEEKNKYLLNYILILSIIIPIGLSAVYSYFSDFQPQGRYIMGIIVPFTYFLVNGIKTILDKIVKNKKIRNIIVGIIIALIIVISFKALFSYIIPTYKGK